MLAAQAPGVFHPSESNATANTRDVVVVIIVFSLHIETLSCSLFMDVALEISAGSWV